MLANHSASLQEQRIATHPMLDESLKAYFGTLIKLLNTSSRKLALEVFLICHCLYDFYFQYVTTFAIQRRIK